MSVCFTANKTNTHALPSRGVNIGLIPRGLAQRTFKSLLLRIAKEFVSREKDH